MAPFSVIVFGVVVWTIAVSGAKQLRFRLKTDYCGLVTPAIPLAENPQFTDLLQWTYTRFP